MGLVVALFGWDQSERSGPKRAPYSARRKASAWRASYSARRRASWRSKAWSSFNATLDRVVNAADDDVKRPS